jgi:UDP-3-O-[3-hydroxymyristoyl] glucosamine N-acyltransferase
MTCTAQELAERIGAELQGDGQQRVSGCGTPEEATADVLIYIDSHRRVGAAGRSSSRCVVLDHETATNGELDGRTLLRVPNPKLAFARAVRWMYPEPPLVQGVHATAIVAASATLGAGVAIGPYAVIEDGAEVGEGSQIGAHCHVGRDVRLGPRCTLYPRATLYAGVRLGAQVVVHAGAVIGSDGFGLVRGEDGYEKFPQIGIVEIGDDVEIGANATIDRGALGATRIERGVKIDNLVHVGHNCSIGRHTTISAQTGLAGSSVVGENAVIGGQVGIGGHCRLEDGALVGSKAGVLPGKILRGGIPMWGVPAQPLDVLKKINAWYNRLPELADRLRRLERIVGVREE